MIARRLLLTAAGGGASFSIPIGNGILSAGSPSTITADTRVNAYMSVCRLANDDLLLVYMKSDTFGADNTGKVVGKLSANDGASWGTEFTVADETLAAINNGLVRLPSGRVVMVYNLFDGTGPTTPADACRTIYSDDTHLGGSATWSSPATINSTFTDYCAAPVSRPIRLADGTIITPVYGQNSGDSFASAQAFFSTDDGATFGGQVTIADGPADGRHYFEPSLVVRLDGSILCHMRTTEFAGSTYQCVSTNGGVTWSAPASAFGGYAPSNVYRRYNRTLVATTRGNAAAKLQAFTSIDAGTSWQDQGVLDSSSPMHYAVAIDKLNRDLLVIYSVENGAVADIKSRVLTEGAA